MNWKKPAFTEEKENVVRIPKRWLNLYYYEALNILFRFENALRIFVYVLLKNEKGTDWVAVSISNGAENVGTIESVAKQRINQAANFGYLGYEVTCPIMHLTSGELVGIITSDSFWPLFKPYFKGSKDIIKNKLQEIGTVRNSLAHFRPIKEDDISLLEQDAKHTLMGVEECLGNLFATNITTPTNSEDDWYREITQLESGNLQLEINQSSDEQWIRVAMTHESEILSENHYQGVHSTFMVTTMLTPKLLLEYPDIAKAVTYLTESASGHYVSREDCRFAKTVSFVFSRESLSSCYVEISESLKAILELITSEVELLLGDKLARGRLVAAVRVMAYRQSEEENYEIYNSQMECPFKNDDPPEYWGNFGFYKTDFISASELFPWMEARISQYDPW